MSYNNLETQDDISLVKNIKENSYRDDSLRILINRHSGICFDVASRYLEDKRTPDSVRNDIVNHKDYVIYDAALKFDENRGNKFSTHVGRTMRYYCLRSIQEEKKHHDGRAEICDTNNDEGESNFYLEKITDTSPTFLEQICNDEKKQDKKQVILDTLNECDEITKKIITMRFFQNGKRCVSLREVAKKVGMTAEAVRLRQNKFFRLTKSKIPVELRKDN